MYRQYVRLIAALMCAVFFWTAAMPSFAIAQSLQLPAPGVMVKTSEAMEPPVLRGVKVYPKDPLRLDFILDPGTAPAADSKVLSEKVLRYFLAALTVPETDLWVNLSPFEKDRIIPDGFGLTEMGRDLLGQDYLLKQVTATLIYPDDARGKRFWSRIYEAAYAKFGTTDIPVDTFTKVWIVPQSAEVYVGNGTAVIGDARLKVLLESDYLAAKESGTAVADASAGGTQEMAKQVMREVVIPALEREVNEGANFAPLRQVYHSLILAVWYKKKIGAALLGRAYVDRNKVQGVNIEDPREAQKIWDRYVQAFKKGAFNLIREEKDQFSDDLIPRKYFSGGVNFGAETSAAMKVYPAGKSWADRSWAWLARPLLMGMVSLQLVGGIRTSAAAEQFADMPRAQNYNELVAPLREKVEASYKKYSDELSRRIKKEMKDRKGTQLGPEFRPLMSKVRRLDGLGRAVKEQSPKDINYSSGKNSFLVSSILKKLLRDYGDEFSALDKAYRSTLGLHRVLKASPGRPTILYISPTSGFPFYKLDNAIETARKNGDGLIALAHDPTGTALEIGDFIRRVILGSPEMVQLIRDGQVVVVTMSGSSTYFLCAVRADQRADGKQGLLHNLPVIMWAPVLNGSKKALSANSMPAFIRSGVLAILDSRGLGNLLESNNSYGATQQGLARDRLRLLDHLGPIHLALIRDDEHLPGLPWEALENNDITDEVLEEYSKDHFAHETLLWMREILRHGGKISVTSPTVKLPGDFEPQTNHEKAGFVFGPSILERDLEALVPRPAKHSNDPGYGAAIKAVISDKAQDLNGGIDLNGVNQEVRIDGKGGDVEFAATEDLLRKIAAAEGLAPVVKSMELLPDISVFLGKNN